MTAHAKDWWRGSLRRRSWQCSVVECKRTQKKGTDGPCFSMESQCESWLIANCPPCPLVRSGTHVHVRINYMAVCIPVMC